MVAPAGLTLFVRADDLLFVYSSPGTVPLDEFTDWYDNEHVPAPGSHWTGQVPCTTKRVPGTGACAAICDQDSAVHVVVSDRHVPQGKPAIYV
jgi:hypothetical protein